MKVSANIIIIIINGRCASTELFNVGDDATLVRFLLEHQVKSI